MKKLYKIKKSNIDKKGLYASTNIKEGIKIIEYKGKIISVKETEINPKPPSAMAAAISIDFIGQTSTVFKC